MLGFGLLYINTYPFPFFFLFSLSLSELNGKTLKERELVTLILCYCCIFNNQVLLQYTSLFLSNPILNNKYILWFALKVQ